MENDAGRIFKRAMIGFLIGMLVGNLAVLLPDLFAGQPLHWVTSGLLQRVGSLAGAIIVQSFFSGLLGAVSFAGMFFYEIESWSMYKAAALHYLMIVAVFIPIGVFLGWIMPVAADILIMAGIMTLGYLIVWLIMYWNYRRQAESLNEELRNKK